MWKSEQISSLVILVIFSDYYSSNKNVTIPMFTSICMRVIVMMVMMRMINTWENFLFAVNSHHKLFMFFLTLPYNIYSCFSQQMLRLIRSHKCALCQLTPKIRCRLSLRLSLLNLIMWNFCMLHNSPLMLWNLNTEHIFDKIFVFIKHFQMFLLISIKSKRWWYRLSSINHYYQVVTLCRLFDR